MSPVKLAAWGSGFRGEVFVVRVSVLTVCLAAAPILLACIPATSAGAQSVWLDPSSLPFVPAPTVESAMTPKVDGESCTGTSDIRTGPMAAGVSSISVHVEVRACQITAASVTWTVQGSTYEGALDAVSGRVSQIAKLSQGGGGAPGLLASDASCLAQDGVYGSLVPGNALETSSSETCSDSGGPQPYWNYRAGHTWLHFWDRAGTGNENVVANLEWGYAGVREKLQNWDGSCDADGRWLVLRCDRSAVETDTRVSSYAKGTFHNRGWPDNHHTWDAVVYPNDNETAHGQCTSTGDLPWWYGSECKVQAGYR